MVSSVARIVKYASLFSLGLIHSKIANGRVLKNEHSAGFWEMAVQNLDDWLTEVYGCGKPMAHDFWILSKDRCRHGVQKLLEKYAVSKGKLPPLPKQSEHWFMKHIMLHQKKGAFTKKRLKKKGAFIKKSIRIFKNVVKKRAECKTTPKKPIIIETYLVTLKSGSQLTFVQCKEKV
jgi:hypothetical protein